MLPTFLGLGAAKAGTTWLHELLASHPHVWMPRGRKEVHFFDRHYEEGFDWYERFFPTGEEAERYRAAGEITPGYLDDPRCPERIAEAPSVRQLLVGLRDPVERLHSAYGHHVRNRNYRRSFADFIDECPEEVERGYYARHLKRYLRHFEREQLLVLRFGCLFDDVPATQRALADFLGLDAALFPEDAGRSAVNKTYVPRFQRAFALAQKGLRWLRRREWTGALRFIQRSGLGAVAKRLMGRREDGVPPASPETRRRLRRRYADDVEELECLVGDDFVEWKAPAVNEE